MATGAHGCGFDTTQTHTRNIGWHPNPNPKSIRVENWHPRPHPLGSGFSTQTRNKNIKFNIINTQTHTRWVRVFSPKAWTHKIQQH